jgi:methylenetetrahydrofolate reductase (NADPH)
MIMETSAVPPHAATVRERIVALVRRGSIEVSARDPLAGEGLRAIVDPGTTVFINYAPGDNHHGIIAAATRLQRAGFEPVPHIVARHLASFTQLNDYLVRIAGEAGVRRALVLAGDPERPVGPFDSSLELLETGLFAKHGVRHVAVAGYPEGHPRISTHTLDAALLAKTALAREQGLALEVVTQFGFEAPPIIRWIRQARALGSDMPIRIGLAGPASISTLAKFAVRCGIGQSLRALVSGHASVARLLTEAGPERIIRALALALDEELDGVRLHFFTFGGVRRTSAWIRAVAAGDIVMASDGSGFVVRDLRG